MLSVTSLLTSQPPSISFPIDLEVFDQWRRLERRVLSDPWDRFIVATAIVEGVPLVTRDEAISGSGYLQTVW